MGTYAEWSVGNHIFKGMPRRRNRLSPVMPSQIGSIEYTPCRGPRLAIQDSDVRLHMFAYAYPDEKATAKKGSWSWHKRHNGFDSCNGKLEGKNLATNRLAASPMRLWSKFDGLPSKWCWVEGFRLQVSVITGKICCLVDLSYVQPFLYRDVCSADLRSCSFTKHLQCQLQGLEWYW